MTTDTPRPTLSLTRHGPLPERERPKAYRLLTRLLYLQIPVEIHGPWEVTLRLSEAARDLARPHDKVRQALLYLERGGYLQVISRTPGRWRLRLTPVSTAALPEDGR